VRGQPLFINAIVAAPQWRNVFCSAIIHLQFNNPELTVGFVQDSARPLIDGRTMCGRFVQKTDLKEAGKIFEAVIEAELRPNYNVAPRQPIAVIMEDGMRKIVEMQWGLIPHWAKNPSIANKLINARSETLAEKPSFKESFKSRRCLIIADGFYEWQTKEGIKKPYFIFMKDKKPFGMAGLYDNWKNEEGKTITTCTIVTTEANEFMKSLHHRMPVIIAPEQYDLWLDSAEKDTSKISALMKPWDAKNMDAYEVSQRVNSPVNNSDDCINPI
jgi:putative SOS response-associated peptidase YedK